MAGMQTLYAEEIRLVCHFTCKSLRAVSSHVTWRVLFGTVFVWNLYAGLVSVVYSSVNLALGWASLWWMLRHHIFRTLHPRWTEFK